MSAIVSTIGVGRDRESSTGRAVPGMPVPGRGQKIEYLDLCKSYGAVEALKPTNLQVEPGEFFAIIGPSGSGKTTLLGLTAGFVTPTSGRILLGGVSIETMPPFERNIGMVFQNYSLFPHMTVGQNIAFPLRMRHVSKTQITEKVRDALKLVRLDDLEDRYPDALSGGQQQRVALARAAVYDPRLLLMDEPLSALDKNLREEMQFEIKQLQAKLGSTVLYVTHDQGEAASMAHRIAVMHSGTVVQVDGPQELYRNPRNRFVASFLGQANILEIETFGPAERGATVATDFGLRLRTSMLPALAGRKCVCIRPEAIRIAREAFEQDNVAKGIVVDATFATGIQRHWVEVARGVILQQSQQAGRESELFAPGTSVHLGWAASDTLIVSDQ